MAEENTGATPAAPVAPATPPAAPATAPTGQTPAPAVTPAPGTEAPTATVTVPLKEWEQTQRDAARHRSRKGGSQPSAEDKRNQRYNQPPASGDGEDDQEVQQLRSQVQTVEKENLQLKLTNKVRDLLESDTYKNAPDAVKRLLKRNPLAVVDPRAATLEDAVADIQDYLDEELEQSAPGTTAAAPGQPAETTPTSPETPPVMGAVPAPAGAAAEESVEGKTGTDRSRAVLKNIFKKAGK